MKSTFIASKNGILSSIKNAIWILFSIKIASSFLVNGAIAQTETTTERLPFVTLRDKSGDQNPVLYFGNGRGGRSNGWCGISERRINSLAALARSVPFYIPEKILNVSTIIEANKEDVFNSLTTPGDDKNIVLHLHGYRTDFEKGCRRAYALRQAMGLKKRFLFFSWPSDGDTLSYTHDETDLSWSIPEIAGTISELVDKFGEKKVNLTGHSMGARGIFFALYELAFRKPNIRVGQVALLAPDIDFQIFEKMLPLINSIASGITVYVTDADRALAFSEQLHGYPRLGQSGNKVSSLEGVSVIDLSNLPTQSASGHLYHIYNPEVGKDLAKLIEGQFNPSDRGLKNIDGNLWRIEPAL